GGVRACLPLVVPFDPIAVADAPFRHRVCQHASDPPLGEAWPESANHPRLCYASPNNNAPDKNGSAGANLSTRGHIAEATARLAQIVNFEECDSALRGLLRVRI